MSKSRMRKLAESCRKVTYLGDEYYANVTRTTESTISLCINLDLQDGIREELRTMNLEKELEDVNRKLDNVMLPHHEWVELSNRRNQLCMKLNRGKAVCEDYNGNGIW